GTGDRAGAHVVSTWRKVQPDRLTRSRSFWISKWYTWNFGRQIQGDGIQMNGNATLNNYIALNSGLGLTRRVQDDGLTRGGPSASAPSGWFWYSNFDSDRRKPLSIEVNTNLNGNEVGSSEKGFNLSFSLKPSSRLTISTGPRWNWSHGVAQYI